MGLGHAGGDGADAGGGDQLHADPGVRVDLLQVVDELGQILDRVDVVVRRRRDQGHAGRGVAQPGDQAVHLDAGKLAALAGLRALGHLDLDLAAVVQVFRRHAEAAGSDLLDRRARVVAVRPRPEAGRILAALAAVGLRADAVHGDGEGLVRLRAQRAERDARGDQPLADVGDRLDLVERHRLLDLLEAEQVAQVDRPLFIDRVRIALVEVVAVGLHRALQGMHHIAVEGVTLAGAPVAVQPAHRQRHDALVEGLLVHRQRLGLDAVQAEAGDTRGHAREILLDQGAGQADRLEVVAAAIGGQNRDAHLGHHLQQAVLDRLLVVGEAVLQRPVAEQAARQPVGNRLLHQVRVDGGAADADQHGEVMHVQHLAAAHVDGREGAELLSDQMAVHRAGRQDHRHAGPGRRGLHIRQDHVGAAAAHGVLGLLTDPVERRLERVRAALGVEGAVDLRRRLRHVVAHGMELGIGQHRAFQQQVVALLAVLVEDVAQVAQTGTQGHHPALAQAVDRRVGDLAEVLPEEVVQTAILVRQHRQRRVVAHGADGFLAALGHRLQQQLHVFQRPAGDHLAAAQHVTLEGRLLLVLGADQLVDLGALGDPLAERPAGGQQVLQLGVVVELTFLQIDGDHLARIEPALFDQLGLVDAHHAGLGAADQQAVIRHRIAQRPQPVAVHAAEHPAPAIGGDRRRAVPRLHHRVGIGVEVAPGLRQVVFLGPGLRDAHGLHHGQLTAGADHQLEGGVQGGAVGGACLHHRLQVLDEVAEGRMRHPGLVARHPVDVALDRVDLAVMGQHAERLGQLPGREGVGRVALVIDGEVRDEPLVGQVGIELVDLLGQEHALVDDRPAGHRADVEIGDVLGQRRLLDPAADDVEVALDLLGIMLQRRGEHDLLDLRAGGVRLLADHRDVDRHLAPAVDETAGLQDLGLDDDPAALLGGQVGARQEDHADADPLVEQLVAGIGDLLAEEVRRDLDMDARTVAGLAVGIDSTTVPDRLQRLDRRGDDLAPRLAVDGGDEADTAGLVLMRRVVGVAGLQLGRVLPPLAYEGVAVQGLAVEDGRVRHVWPP